MRKADFSMLFSFQVSFPPLFLVFFPFSWYNIATKGNRTTSH